MNENLFVVTTDWHVVSNDSESGAIGETHPTDAAAVATHIAGLTPAGVIDMGDAKDHYGTDTGDEQDNYIAKVQGTLPYATVLPGANASLPILPGNHDEVEDYNTVGAVTDFSMFDARFWGAPYHWQVNWDAARIRFIGIHTYIHHSTDGMGGYAHVDSTEVSWLRTQLHRLPANWQAIPCSHFPVATSFGNYVHFLDDDWNDGGSTIRALLAEYSDRIACYLNGHRHQNMDTETVDGIPHFSCPGMAYTQGNVYGGFVPITLDPTARTLTLDYLYGPPHPGGYTRFSGYTPHVLQLPTATSLTKVRRAA